MEVANDSLKKRYTAGQHSTSIMEGFYRLWQDNVMCDTRLVVEDQIFHVHRTYLAVCSSFFSAMFTTNFQEREQLQVELKGVSADGLLVLLNYAYTGTVDITPDSVGDVLAAASYLQFNQVVSFCADFMVREWKFGNCAEFLRLANLYELKEPKELLKAQILDGFAEFTQTTDFLRMDVDTLSEMLTDDELRLKSEMDAFKAASNWISSQSAKDVVSRKVLPLIRYGLIPSDQMHTVYRTVHDLVGGSCNDILQMAASYHVSPFKQPFATSSIGRLRCGVEGVVFVGGSTWCEEHYSKHFYFGTLDEGILLERYSELGLIRDGRGCESFGAAVSKNFLYIAGGIPTFDPRIDDEDDYDSVTKKTNKVFRFDPRTQTWLELQAMEFGRGMFVLVALEDSLLAIGGKSSSNGVLKSVESYDIKKNEWSAVADMPRVLFSHAGVSLNGKVYISGGHPGRGASRKTNTQASHDLILYDPENNQWSRRCPMHTGRACHIMVLHNDKIFTCTGYSGDEHDPFHGSHTQNAMNTEYYDPQSDQWTRVADIGHATFDATAICHDSKIYIFGGNGQEIQYDLQIYYIEDDDWFAQERALPRRNACFAACIMDMPHVVVKEEEEDVYDGDSDEFGGYLCENHLPM